MLTFFGCFIAVLRRSLGVHSRSVHRQFNVVPTSKHTSLYANRIILAALKRRLFAHFSASETCTQTPFYEI